MTMVTIIHLISIHFLDIILEEMDSLILILTISSMMISLMMMSLMMMSSKMIYFTVIHFHLAIIIKVCYTSTKWYS